MTMYDSPLAELERQQCYSGDVTNTLIPVIASSMAESQPESSHVESGPIIETSPSQSSPITQPQNPASTDVNTSVSVADTVSRTAGDSL